MLSTSMSFARELASNLSLSMEWWTREQERISYTSSGRRFIKYFLSLILLHVELISPCLKMLSIMTSQQSLNSLSIDQVELLELDKVEHHMPWLRQMNLATCMICLYLWEENTIIDLVKTHLILRSQKSRHLVIISRLIQIKFVMAHYLSICLMSIINK